MNRRGVLALIGGAALAWPPGVWAQPTDRARLIAILVSPAESSPTARPGIAALRDELAKQGWVEGRNLRLEIRYGGASMARLREYAAELAGVVPDVILAYGNAALEALRELARGLPIVFVVVVDPVGRGFVQSLARPGGNMTGFTNVEFSLDGKWLELLKEIAPQTTRVAPIGNPDTIPYDGHLRSVQAAAVSLGMEVIAAPVHDRGELEAAITAMARSHGGGLIVLPDSFTGAHRDIIFELTARHRLPAIYATKFACALGALISYHVDQIGQFRQAASYIDRILRGAKPADLPVQQPTRFELAINLKTAQALGLTVPRSLLMRADEVIE